jgi:hypothetical protein
MARMIKFKATCYKCKITVEKGEGFLTRINGKWWAHCKACYALKKKAEK